MWAMLQSEKPEDLVIGTGESASVRDFLILAFKHVGLDWQDHVVVDPAYFRPTEVDHLRADVAKARQAIGWEPSVDLPGLVRLMIEADMKLAREERLLADAGHFHPMSRLS